MQGLRDLWQHLNSKLFRRLDQNQTGAVNRLEAGVLKLYVINCVQNRNTDKVREFFEKMSPELHGQSDWKEWFALPFLSNPESNPAFVSFFARNWQDTLLLSLHNFLAIVFASLPPPKLANYQNSTTKLKRLKDENDAMRQTLLRQVNKIEKVAPLDIPRPTDVMDDFYIIASHESNPNPTENHAKGLKGFLRNITGSGSNPPSAPKERSSSRSRTPSSSSTVKTHAPVKRLSVNKSNSSLSSSMTISEVSDDSRRSIKVSEVSHDSKTPYLLLGQEVYSEHSSEVTQCRFSPSGYTIASSDVDGVVKIWSASPGDPQTIASFISTSGVSALDWLPNSDQKIVYGSMSGTVRICDKDERKSEKEFSLDHHRIKQINCSNSGNLAAIAYEGQDESGLMLYDLKAMKIAEENLTKNFINSPASVNSCVFNHNAQMIITGNSDGKVRIFDLRKRDCISSWSLSDVVNSQVLTLQMSSDETSIFALNDQGQFSAWSFIQTSQKLFEVNLEDFNSVEEYPRAAWGKQFAFAGDGKHLLICSNNGGVIYQLEDDQKLVKILGLKGHKRHATCTDWSASNDCGPCVTAGFDGQIRISTLLSQ